MKKIIALLLLFSTCIFISACKDFSNLEEFADHRPDIREELAMLNGSENFSMEIVENNIICTYDISNTPGMTEEAAMHEVNKESIEASLNSMESQYSELCSFIEDESGIEGISIVVRYTYQETHIAEKRFVSNPSL